ncbi:unnamed protein product [Coffea canephora]|uniref:Uncharacterized protein n=1 Tax=Coffea canephora TaxID=49390 RepID=A0A068UAF1_COFCA|nr:unnamed protein product [Coffea canephora]
MTTTDGNLVASTNRVAKLLRPLFFVEKPMNFETLTVVFNK